MKQCGYVGGVAAIVAGLFLYALTSYAAFTAGPLTVTFEGEGGLFSEVQLEVGVPVVREVVVTNTGTVTETVYTTVEHATSSGLAELAILSITDEHGVWHYENTFATFFDAGKVALGELAPSEARTYRYSIELADGGDAIKRGMDFDLVVGFLSGSAVTTGGETRTVPEAEEPSRFRLSNLFGGFVKLFARDEEPQPKTELQSEPTGLAEVNRTSSPMTIFIDETYCTFWWLLMLALIPFAWSAYDDWYRRGSQFEQFFVRTAMFTAAFITLLVLLELLGALSWAWWAFAGAWLYYIVTDYRAHEALLPIESIQERNLYFAGAGSFFIITSFFFGFPCEWWPFMLLSVTSGLLYFFDELEKDE